MRTKPPGCADCPCLPHGTDFSRIEGTGSLGVMIVGEASGEHEQRDQLPFRPYAPAGAILERTFRRMALRREQFSITNTLRCRPRNNWLDGSPWEYSALRHCRPNLDAAIAEHRPRAILALGGIATRELTGLAGDAQGVSHLAGYAVAGPSQIPVIPTFHPAFIRRGKASYQGVLARHLRRSVDVAAGRDRDYAFNIEEYAREHLRYALHPSLGEAWSYADKINGNAGLAVSYDIETYESASLDEDARDGFTDTRIRLIQFSTGAGEGIAFPWEGEYRAAAARILRSPNVKFGHNTWLFDDKVLRACGEREGIDLRPRGVVHDTLQMFHHWQPDLPAHLQFAAQWVRFPFPWKHLAGTDLPFYGCCDTDSTWRLFHFLRDQLMREGLWDGIVAGQQTLGYVGQVAEVRPVLAAMEERGLPVDDVERQRLDVEFDAAQREVAEELWRRAPVECRRVHPKQGYKGVPPQVKAVDEDVAGLRFNDDGEFYIYVKRLFDVVADDLSVTQVPRWCRLYEFNPNSSQQLLAYMRAMKHPVPKSRKNEDAEGNAKDTTEKKELERLAKRHGDNFYLKVIEYREIGKAKGTYIAGFKPHDDGRVHTTFTFDTGTGQLSSRNPNIQNFMKHGRLAKATRRMIAAPEGYELAEFDYKAYHVLTTGYCAGDADYMRLARLDMHSYVAGHFLKCWDADTIRHEPDDALADRFRWFKTDPERKRVRDKQAKPSILGIGFGMGYRRLYQENLEHFEGEAHARKFHDVLHALFPKVFVWQDSVRKQAHEQQHLKSPFGHIRRFYEVYRWDGKKGGWAPGDQAEEAVAFLPANIAFGNIRETMKDLERRGLSERFGLVNNVHDSVMFCYRRELRDELLATVPPVLMAPSRVLINPLVAPQGLSVECEACVGPNWAEMVDTKFPQVEAAHA